MTTSPSIRLEARARCAACGATGSVVHRRLRDWLFGAPLTWTLARCDNPRCGLHWLDPAPHPEDLNKLYAAYYTHVEPARPAPPSALKRDLRQAYLARRYGYALPVGRLARLASWLLWLSPQRTARLDNDAFHLPAVPGGRVLEVGCGAGEMLHSLRAKGWRAEGIDFDPRAVAAARSSGLDVRLGDLKDAPYPAASFDAVVMRHVIEHVPDPVQLLRECHRLLAPGGRLVVVTPNAQSLGHRVYGRAWRGLEPPRHLYVFTAAALASVVEQAAFRVERLTSSALEAGANLALSSRIAHAERESPGAGAARTLAELAPAGVFARARAHLLEWAEWTGIRLGLRTGEELVLVGMKP